MKINSIRRENNLNAKKKKKEIKHTFCKRIKVVGKKNFILNKSLSVSVYGHNCIRWHVKKKIPNNTSDEKGGTNNQLSINVV